MPPCASGQSNLAQLRYNHSWNQRTAARRSDWTAPWMLRRGLSGENTSCTEWKLCPGTTVNMAIEFHSGSMTVAGTESGTPLAPSSSGYNSSPPPS